MEAGGVHFLYENREPCTNIALVQIAVYLFSFIFTYTVWWAPTLGLLVAFAGLYGASVPVVEAKVNFIRFYYFGNFFILILQVISAVILIIFVSELEIVSGWDWTMALFGSICFGLELYITYTAILRAEQYRLELVRNPPPEAAMVYSQPFFYHKAPSGDYVAPPLTEVKAF